METNCPGLSLAEKAREHIIAKYGSHKKAAEAYGVTVSMISHIVMGRRNPPLYMLHEMGVAIEKKTS